MQANELFVSLPPVDKAPKLPADQFEFAIDRKGRKIAGFFDVFGRRESIRVRTNHLFTWSGNVELPDNSTGMTREIACVLELEGAVEPNEAAAREVLQAALEADFDLNGLVRRLVTNAMNQQRASLGGAFLSAMRDKLRRQDLLNNISDTLRRGGVPVKRVALVPIMQDDKTFRDFEDLPGTLAVRSSGTLEANTVGYKARLGWGGSDEQKTARLVYRGAIEGSRPGPSLPAPLVPGQVQPLEAWFRTLLTEAIGQHPWRSVLTGDAATLTAIREAVSQKLGAGTGRVVDALDILPTVGGQARLPERTMTFQHRYPITGVQGGALEIEHTIGYALKDRDRWVAQGSPHPEDTIRPHVIEATRAFLAGKRFKDVVSLYLLGTDGETQLRDAISSRVSPYASAIGCRLVSTAVILSIPEKDFIEGRRMDFPTATYSLADPNLAPAMELSLSVKVGSTPEARDIFARALTEHDAFEARVRTAVLDAVRTSLRRLGALSYYASHYVNGSPEELGDAEAPAPREEDNVTLRLKADVMAELRPKFGLDVIRIDLKPAEDPLIDRMKALTNLPIRFDEDIEFEHGESATTATMKAFGTIFIVTIDPNNWSSFYNNAARIGDDALHINRIRDLLVETLRLAYGEVVQPGPGGLRESNIRQMIVDRFTARVRKEFGLLVQLDPLVLRINRPGAGDTAAYILRDLHDELRRLSQQRAALAAGSTLDDPYRRTEITERIRKVRDEIADEEKLQENTIARTEIVRIEQDWDTGKLLSDH
jgi:hypothetical protein